MENKRKKTDVKPGIRHKLITLASALVILIVATAMALWVSYAAEGRSFASQTIRTTQQINEQVTLSIGTLHSMAAAHQASPNGFVPAQFEMFAENLVTNQAALTAAGRYDVLLHEDLDLYKTDLQLHGLVEFEPKEFSADESFTPLTQKKQYSTLIAFHPQDPVSASFIGLDFSAIEETQRAINVGVVRNALIPAQLPAQWFANGQLNIFVATYFGHYIPDAIQDRQLQTDGGYFITLDLETVIQQATDQTAKETTEQTSDATTDQATNPFANQAANEAANKTASEKFPLSVGILVDSISGTTFVADQNAPTTQKRTASRLFPSRPIKHNLSIGAESATIVYRTPAGVTQSQLVSALAKGIAALVLFLIGYTILRVIRGSRRQILANEKALTEERERALVTLNSLQDAVVTTDSNDNIDYINPAMQVVLNAGRDDIIGLPLQTVLDGNFTDENIDTNDENSNDNSHANSNINSINSIKRLKDRSIDESEDRSSDKVVFDCHSSSIVGQNNEKIGAVLTMRNVSKEHALTTRLAYQATHDALTGLPNRRRFETLLENILQVNSSEQKSCHVVGYIDLDQFKLVNDTVGHAAGDVLLKKLATDLESHAPEHIEIARLGGDEFGFISTGCNLSTTIEVANSFHEFFQSYFYHAEDNTFSIRASIGLTTIKPYHTTINDVLSEVDIACYTAKDAGRNGYVVYDSEDLETKKREGEMLYLPMLQTALTEDRFVLYAQKIVSTTASPDEQAHHYECLLRLVDEDGSIITPYKFIVAAERYDLINDIDRWVLEHAFAQLAQLKGTPHENTIFSINLSGQSAVDPSMPEFIDNALKKYSINSSRICFELTETAVISNFTQAQKLIAFLRNRGCTIALDDFGAGASSFGYLKNLEVDYLKIDGQFVREMTSNKVDFEMVRSMNAVGAALGIQTIAEFVENQEIMDALASINVDFAQGYHIGKPSPLADLIETDQLKDVA